MNMPELPEVETVMRGLTPVMQGKKVNNAEITRDNLRIPFPDNFANRMSKRQVHGLSRRGKYIFMMLDGDETLVVHLGMSGSFRIIPPHKIYTPVAHDHVRFYMEGDNIVIYNDPRRFGMMFMVKTGEEHAHPAFAAMGAEPLGNHFNGQTLFETLQTRKSPIKTALLDQSVVAGVGNIYACEALYQSGISPLRPANALTKTECENLALAIKNVLNAAILSGGSSLRDHKQVDGTMGYFQHHFHVYGREGEICRETGGIIKRIVQSGRSTFYCAEKQR